MIMHGLALCGHVIRGQQRTLVTTDHYNYSYIVYEGMCIHGEKLRTKAPSGEKEPFSQIPCTVIVPLKSSTDSS